MKKKIYIAPIQGATDAPYRTLHHKLYGDDLTYFTPFIRLEKGELRRRDRTDAFGDINDSTDTVPQIIFRDAAELDALVALLRENGARRIDLNMGCPFPLQTARHRGAATVADAELAAHVAETVTNNDDISFSVKMRLGMKDKDEWKTLLAELNKVTLDHITLHPRVARQQYGGEVDMRQFGEFLKASKNPVVYNGDIHTPDDIRNIVENYPDVAGVMVGRGLLGRPSLAAEYLHGEEWERSRRLRMMKKFHQQLFRHYSETLAGGEHQVLSHIQPFWEYAGQEIGRKAWKAIRKAVNMPKYNTALALIEE